MLRRQNEREDSNVKTVNNFFENIVNFFDVYTIIANQSYTQEEFKIFDYTDRMKAENLLLGSILK